MPTPLKPYGGRVKVIGPAAKGGPSQPSRQKLAQSAEARLAKYQPAGQKPWKQLKGLV